MFNFTEKALVNTALAALFIAIIVGTLIHQLMVRDKEALLIRDIKCEKFSASFSKYVLTSDRW
jgi:hypothetical protein